MHFPHLVVGVRAFQTHIPTLRMHHSVRGHGHRMLLSPLLAQQPQPSVVPVGHHDAVLVVTLHSDQLLDLPCHHHRPFPSGLLLKVPSVRARDVSVASPCAKQCAAPTCLDGCVTPLVVLAFAVGRASVSVVTLQVLQQHALAVPRGLGLSCDYLLMPQAAFHVLVCVLTCAQ